MAKRATTTTTTSEAEQPTAPARVPLELRPYQRTPREKFRQGIRRQMWIWHRRAGKDISGLDLVAEEAEQNIGTYWHLYPTHVQAKRAMWNGIDARAQVRFLERAFPQAIRANTLKADMQIELKNGSMYQLCGTDRYDALVGSNVLGVLFSEFALCDPRAWDYIRPILRENNGWVAFITTYRGRNHAYRMAQRVKNLPGWYVDVRTIEDTTDNDGRRIITDEDIAAERAEGMSEALIQQEYFCNPVAAREGAVYGRAVERLISAGRSGNFGYDSSRPVFAAWSIENADEYTVTFWQQDGTAARVIGSKSYQFEALSDCIQDAQHRFPWRYISRHVLPHGTPAENIDAFERHSAIVELAPELDDVYSVTRDQLATTWIDDAPRAWCDEEPNNERLIDALNGYRFSKSSAGQSYTNRAVNSWESRYARSLEVLAAYRHAEPDNAGGWYPPPSRANQDRAVI